jgi:hypothetical protein
MGNNTMKIITDITNIILDKKLEVRNLINHISAAGDKKATAAYLGWIGNDNLGDEILYEAHKKLFSKLNIYYIEPIKFLKLYKLLIKRQIFNIGILGGGTLINQADRWLNETKLFNSNHIPLFCFGTGVASSTFWSKQKERTWENNIKNWVEILSTFKFVGVRGPYSLMTLQKHGLKNIVVVGDTALSLAPNTYKKRELTKVIGINFGSFKDVPIMGDRHKYINELAKLINKLIQQGYTIHLLPIWKSDIKSNKELKRLINDKSCLLEINYNNYSKYVESVLKCDIFLGQKLHSTIISTMHRVPSIMLEYDPKCRDYMASIDMEKYVIGIPEINFNNIIENIEDLYKNYSSIQSNLDINIKKYKKIQKYYAQRIESELLTKNILN